jgi:putative DNA methylase
VADLARLSEREGWRPRPIYQAHRWFARRFGSAFRGLLVAAALPADGDFWAAYYGDIDYAGRTVLDPFVGGGTSVVESLRLGASVVGVDIDPVACAITRFETRAGATPDLRPLLSELKRQVGRRLARYYRTLTPEGDERDVLHYFWVQVVECRHCGARVEAHPHYQLAFEANGTRQWAFCPGCHGVQELDRKATSLDCRICKLAAPIFQGTADRGVLTCSRCQQSERLIEVASRTGKPPEWHLFATEVLEPTEGTRPVPLSRRRFLPATNHDRRVFAIASRAYERRVAAAASAWVPNQAIPRAGRSDGRLISYGYTHYRELFNPRQLLHLSCLVEAISEFDTPAREALGLAFSDHLATSCMMTYYAFGWRRLAPLFALRAYRHVTRPVEINPWADGTGRGTFPNAVRQVQRAAAFARAPLEPRLRGGFVPTPPMPAANGEAARIIQANSSRLVAVGDESVDLVLSDPPYFDNVAYSELADFYRPWLQLLGLTPGGPMARLGLRENLAAKGRGEAAEAQFQRILCDCFREVARVLKPRGRFVFTFQHRCGRAWHALATALGQAGLRPVQVLPLLGNSRAGLHVHDGTAAWDAVLVARPGGRKLTGLPRLSPAGLAAARAHSDGWAGRLVRPKRLNFGRADRLNFFRACLVAGALGAFGPAGRSARGQPLRDQLDTATVC